MMSPAGRRHGRVTMKFALLLGNHVLAHDLGEVYAAGTGFLLSRDPNTVRAADAAFVQAQRLENLENVTDYLPLAPNLATEIVSPNDSFSDVEEKARFWIECGTRMVLVIDPQTRTIHVYRELDNLAVFNEEATLDVSDVVAGWAFAVRDVFR